MPTGSFRRFVLSWSQTQINLGYSIRLLANVQKDYETTMAHCEQQRKMIEEQRQFLQKVSATTVRPFGDSSKD